MKRSVRLPYQSLRSQVVQSISPPNCYPVEFTVMQPTRESAPSPPSPQTDDELVLRELVIGLWHSRWLVVVVTAICTIAAGAASYLSPKKYEATLLLSPVINQTNASGLGALTSAVSQLGGIASLGLPIGGASGAKAESLATLESATLTERYIQENNLLPVLFHDSWDAQHGKWKVADPGKVPTLWKGNQFFGKAVRTVKEAPRTGLVTLTVAWTDPNLAAQWANGLVKMTNDYLREKAIRESDRNIAYLDGQLANISVMEIRNSIYALMESEIKKQMLARGSDEYALKVIDPAQPPEKAASPQRILWALFGLCLGLLLSLSYAFVKVISIDGPADPLPNS